MDSFGGPKPQPLDPFTYQGHEPEVQFRHPDYDIARVQTLPLPEGFIADAQFVQYMGRRSIGTLGMSYRFIIDTAGNALRCERPLTEQQHAALTLLINQYGTNLRMRKNSEVQSEM